MGFHLTKEAEEDIIRIFLEGAGLFGVNQAESYHAALHHAFGIIAEHPKIARQREELSPPVRVHPYKSHIIIYELDDDNNVIIIRVRHGREDWIDD